MNATITSVGGRAPPGRKTRTPSAGSRSPGAAPDSRARARAAAAARPSSGRRAGRRPAHAAAPTSAASRPYTRSSPRSIRSPPIASRARPAAPTPAAPPAPAPPVRTRSVVPWLHPLKSWSLRQSRGGSGAPKSPLFHEGSHHLAQVFLAQGAQWWGQRWAVLRKAARILDVELAPIVLQADLLGLAAEPLSAQVQAT